jgi:TolB-like protein/DNA-binding winged helix-turn-helix (wHTH) protein/cytochrome c-type biogenesis protein CcmH/NrfG
VGAVTAQEFHFADFTLDQSRYRLQRGEHILRLEKRPMELLILLVERRGELVSREEIAERLWGKGVFLEVDRSINTAINKVRVALRDDPEKPRFVETVVGKGYRFAAPVICGNGDSNPQAQPLSVTARVASSPAALSIGEKAASMRLRVLLGGVAILALFTITLVLSRGGGDKGTGQPAIKSLAVLPLKNLSGDPTQEYFADGMTEALIGRLSSIRDLRVISRTSVMRFKDTRMSLPEIANTLHVDAIVEGSVIREGGRVRVHAQLIRGATDEHLWSEAYDRDSGDSLTLESEVTESIAREVGIKLTPQVQRRLEYKPTTNPEAREAYLRAQYFFDKDDKEGATKCLQYLQEAIAKDPNYAAAYAGLSRCYGLAYFFDIFSSAEAGSKIKAAVMKSVELDPGLAEGHAELGDYYFDREWDFSAAEREYKRALELDPNSSVAHSNYSFFLQRIGRADEAVREIHRARDLDPLSIHMADNVAWALLYTRRYDEAVDQFRSVLEMDPNFRRSRWGLARAYELKGMYKEAISECLKIPALPNIDPFAKALFERRCSLYEKVYTTSGAERVNRRWFESARQEIKDAINRDDDPYSIATLYAASGEQEKALDLLERGYVQHDSKLLELKVDPRLDSLRSSPRFQHLLRRMNFPE